MSHKRTRSDAQKELKEVLQKQNPTLEDSFITGQVEEAIDRACNEVCRKYFEFGQSVTESQKADLLTIFTKLGLEEKTAEGLFEAIITSPMVPQSDNEFPH